MNTKLIQDEEMVSYCHNTGSKHTRFVQFKKDPLPKWATDVQPYVPPVDISKFSAKQAYEWVKTGHWNLKQFQEWHNACLESR